MTERLNSQLVGRRDFKGAQMSDSVRRPRYLLGIVGAVVGGVVGYYLFRWIWHQGFYALIIPPALLGLAAGYGIGRRSQLFAVICGVAGFGLALFTEWKFYPFNADKSFLYFVTHFYLMKRVPLAMVAIGTFISYRLALGMDQNAATPPETTNA
jgi:hypothetical protein